MDEIPFELRIVPSEGAPPGASSELTGGAESVECMAIELLDSESSGHIGGSASGCCRASDSPSEVLTETVPVETEVVVEELSSPSGCSVGTSRIGSGGGIVLRAAV